MGLIDNEIGELRKLLKDFEENEVTKQQVMTKIGIYSQIEKRMRLALEAINVIAKYKKDKLDEFMTGSFPQLLGMNKNKEKERCDHGMIKGQCALCKERDRIPDKKEPE